MSFDPFAALGLPRQFDLDRDALLTAWRRTSAQAHPDRAGNDAEAARRTAQINDARQTLEDPESRGNVLLALLGGPTKEENNALPDGYLMEILELREEMEDAKAAGESLEEFEKLAQEQRAQHIAEVGEMFTALNETPNKEALAAIRVELNAWRYVERMIEQLDPEYNPQRADFPLKPGAE